VIRSLACALLLAAFSALAADSTAIFLVARKDMPDPFFHDSVVLVTNATESPVGVIINKPLPLSLANALPDASSLQDRDDKLFFGGPVKTEDVVFVFRAKNEPENAMRLMEGIYVSGNRELLDSLLARKEPFEGLRIFAGHAGWSPGQLETEIQRGDWALAPADASAIFGTRPEELWPELRARASRTKIRLTD